MYFATKRCLSLCFLAFVLWSVGCDESPSEVVDATEEVFVTDLGEVETISPLQCGTELCGENQVCCDFECVDLDSDAAHCGSCGNACDSQMLCVDGLCDCGGRLCETHETCCDSGLGPRCASLEFDEQHCGACGQVCGDGEACYGEVCVCEGVNGITEQCGDGETCCPGTGCIDLNSSPRNCGACGVVCGAGEQCMDGACTCGDLVSETGAAVCAAGEACCNDTCLPELDPQCQCGTSRCVAGEGCCDTTDSEGNAVEACFGLEQDRTHCGACGIACASGEECRGGSCVCETGLGDCDNDASNGCEADLSSDVEHCGGCGLACASGEVCSGGTCQVTCQVGFTNCEGDCVDLNSRFSHCGACGEACAPGEVCSNGSCATSCQQGLTNCGGGDCVNVQEDVSHCGFCGHSCEGGEICSDGFCARSCKEDQTNCGGSCVILSRNRSHCGGCGIACASDEVCSDGACTTECRAGETACNNSCVNLQADVTNCGACGNVCGFGESCDGGACTLFCGELDECGGRCVDLDVDSQNCGSCGASCPAGQFCVDGACELFCSTGLTDCGEYCANLEADSQNCGACENTCPDGYFCSQGACEVNCADGETACGEQCFNLDTNNLNCGACGQACSLRQNCVGGACECEEGFEDCNGDPNDGCEANLNTSPAHCGACGTACGATQFCEAGACLCEGDYADCNGNTTDGCEIYLLGHPLNCGACGQACADNQLCLAGGCTCSGGWGDCNLDDTDGCEVNLLDSDDHCGACGNTCHFDLSCASGICEGDPDLFLRLRFDEGSGTSSFDSSGNGRDGTLTEDMWGDGFANQAALFDGPDVVNTTDFNGNEVAPRDFTASAWIYSTQNSGNRRIIMTHGLYGYGLWINSNNRLYSNICSGQSTLGIQPNTWTHVAYRYDSATTTMAFYVNGDPAGSVGCNYAPSYWTTVRIGALNDTDTSRFQGLIDEVKIWNVVRSEEQIRDEASLLSLRLDDGEGTVAFDSSDLRNLGQIDGATWSTTGAAGGALAFDGTDDVVTVEDDPTLNVKRTFTLEIAVQRDASDLGRAQTLIAKETTGGEGWALWLNADDRLVFSLDGVDVVTGAAIQDGDWHSVQVVRNGERFRIMLDGAEVGLGISAAVIADTSAPILIGLSASGGDAFAGALDEIRLRNTAPTDPDLLVSYRFDEGAGATSLEALGTGRDVQLQDTTTWGDGVVGGALVFDGGSATAPTSGPGLGGQPARFTMSAWIYDEKGPGTYRNLILTQAGGARGLHINNADHLFFYSCSASPTKRVPSRRWTHVAAAYDGAEMTYYIDGEVVATSLCNPGTNWSRLYIGSYNATDAWRFKGRIDEVRVYKRHLSTAEVRELASVTSANLDEGELTTARDTSTLLNDGAISGATWAAGLSGNALAFDGVDDVVTFDSRPSDATTEERLLVELDVQRATTGTDETLAARWDGTDGDWRLHFDETDRVALTIAGYGKVLSSETPITDTAWHHVALYREGDSYTIDIDDGRDIRVLSRADHNAATTTALTLGDTLSGGTPFSGVLDNLRFAPFQSPDPAFRFAYHFDEAAGTSTFDESGYGWHGTLQNGTTWGEGVSGSALSFDGADDWVSTRHSSNLALPEKWTLSGWVYDEKGSGNRRHILQINGNAGWYIETNNYLYFSSCYNSNRGIPSGRWVHIASVYDGTNMTYYIDGQPAGGRACTPYGSWAYARIGASSGSDIYRFKGRIDELRFENRALTEEEILKRASLLSWDLDEGRDIIVRDDSHLMHEGRVNGATWLTRTEGTALAFDGTDDVVTSPGTDALDLDIDAFTIQLEIKRDTTVDAAQTLIAKDDGSTTGGWSLAFDSGNRIVFRVRGSGITLQGASPITDTDWHTVRVIRQGSLWRLTLDDVEDGNRTDRVTLSSTSANFSLGALADGSEPFHGAIDGVRIWRGASFDSEFVARFRLDENTGTTTTDESGNDLDGLLRNGATWTRGVSGSAVLLDGADDWVSTPYNGTLTMPSTWTISAWVYDTKPDGSWRTAVNVTTNSNGLQINTSDRLSYSGCTASSGFVPKNRWTHIAAVYDGSNMRYYVDGVPRGAPACTRPTAWNRISLGSYTSASESYRFKGAIDEVGVYDRALSADEIEALSSVAYFAFDESFGVIANDDTGLSEPATLSGPTWTAGAEGTAVAFDGNDDVATIPHADALNLDLQDFTIGLTLRRDGSLGAAQTVLAKDDGTTARGWRVLFDADNRPTFWLRGHGEIVWGAPITDTAWHDIEIRREGDRYRLFTDGAEQMNRPYLTTPAGSDTALLIGDSADSDSSFHGAIDTLRLTYTVPADPYAYLSHRLDEGTGTVADDGAHYDFDLNIQGATWDEGIAQRSLSFDGVNDRAWSESRLYVEPGPTTWTLSAWVYDEKGPGTNRYTIFMRGNSVFYINTSNALVYPGCAASSGRVESYRWTHIGATFDGTTLRYYIDGQPAGSPACSAYNFDNLMLASTTTNTDNNRFRGRIDEVRMINRVLSPEEMLHFSRAIALDFEAGHGDTAFDRSDLLNDGAISGATWAAGNPGTALAFDGTDDVVTVRNNPSLELDTAQFMVSVDFQRGGGLGSSQALVAKDDDSAASGWSLYINDFNRLAFEIESAGAVIVSETAITDTNWHNVRVERSGDYFTLFIDDAMDATSIDATTINRTGLDITLGDNLAGSAPFQGNLDNLAITPFLPNSGRLRFAYDFDSDDTSTLFDRSGNGYNGALLGGPTRVDGVSGNALSFDGINDYVDIAVRPRNAPTNWAFSAWIYDDKGSSTRRLFMFNGSTGIYVDSNDRLYVPSCSPSTRRIRQREWTHVAIRYDGLRVRYYINGKLSGDISCTNAYTAWYNPLIAAYNSSETTRWRGYIDELYIFEDDLDDATFDDLAKTFSLHLDRGLGARAYDSTFGNHGDISGATWTTGVSGAALAFDGTDDVVTIPAARELDLDDQFTWNLSVKRARTNTAETLIARDDGSTAGRWSLGFDASNALELRYDGAVILSGGSITDTAWHDIALERSGENILLLIDGVEAGWTSWTNLTPLAPSGVDLTLGDATGGSPFQGSIDEISLRPYAMTPARILNHWTFDEGSGSTAVDFGSERMDANIPDASYWTTGENGAGSGILFDAATTPYDIIYASRTSDNPPLEWSFQAWIYDARATYYRRIVSFNTGSTGLYVNSSNVLQYSGCSAGNVAVPTNTWTHVAMTSDGLNVRYYIDGAPAGVVACNASRSWNTISFGAYRNNDGFYFLGTIDDIIVHGEKRTDAQIAADATP